jgi:hypothetical protein
MFDQFWNLQKSSEISVIALEVAVHLFEQIEVYDGIT